MLRDLLLCKRNILTLVNVYLGNLSYKKVDGLHSGHQFGYVGFTQVTSFDTLVSPRSPVWIRWVHPGHQFREVCFTQVTSLERCVSFRSPV